MLGVTVRSHYLLVALEALGWGGAVVFTVIWFFDPKGNWEPLFGICTLVGIGTDVYRRAAARAKSARFPTESARIQHREVLRKAFRAEILECRARKLRQDVIIRHVDRVDRYPDIDEGSKGISPWFKAYLLDTYEKGIVLGLTIGGLKECDDGYRYVDYANGEKADLSASLMADVPYDSIEAVNMEGDKYYHYPHIYCYFDFNGEPYERKWFAQQIDMPHGHPYFKQIASREDVVRNNPQEGPLYFA